MYLCGKGMIDEPFVSMQILTRLGAQSKEKARFATHRARRFRT